MVQLIFYKHKSRMSANPIEASIDQAISQIRRVPQMVEKNPELISTFNMQSIEEKVSALYNEVQTALSSLDNAIETAMFTDMIDGLMADDNGTALKHFGKQGKYVRSAVTTLKKTLATIAKTNKSPSSKSPILHAEKLAGPFWNVFNKYYDGLKVYRQGSRGYDSETVINLLKREIGFSATLAVLSVIRILETTPATSTMAASDWYLDVVPIVESLQIRTTLKQAFKKAVLKHIDRSIVVETKKGNSYINILWDTSRKAKERRDILQGDADFNSILKKHLPSYKWEEEGGLLRITWDNTSTLLCNFNMLQYNWYDEETQKEYNESDLKNKISSIATKMITVLKRNHPLGINTPLEHLREQMQSISGKSLEEFIAENDEVTHASVRHKLLVEYANLILKQLDVMEKKKTPVSVTRKSKSSMS